jgi:hypothetical protein
MATVTPNFNWPVPTSTDLVKDGATAIEALGDSIDASLVDLKGGTTGQILSKTSNTDMDFTWVANDVGDITAVTAGTGITGGGTSGAVTVSFDQANFGGGQFAAGKNKIINGDFNVNQRAFTSSTSSGTFGFDRFSSIMVDGTVTYSAQTFTTGAAPVAGYEGKNFARIVTTGQTLATARANLTQGIEDVRALAGQTATVSFWAKAATGTPKIAIELNQSFGTGGSPSAGVQTYAGQVTLSTSWARYSVTIAIPSISGKTIGTNSDSALQLNLFVSAGSNLNARTGSLGIQSNTFDIWGVQAEAGSVATPFQTATGTLQGELAACQRYYYRATIAVTPSRLGVGMVSATTNADLTIFYPVPMRTSPTALEQNGTATDYSVITSGNTITICNAVPNFGNATTTQAQTNFPVASGLVAGQACLGRPVNTNAYLGWSAEL